MRVTEPIVPVGLVQKHTLTKHLSAEEIKQMIRNKNKGSSPDVPNKEKATVINQFFISHSTIEDSERDDARDVPELIMSINEIRFECRRSQEYSYGIKRQALIKYISL